MRQYITWDKSPKGRGEKGAIKRNRERERTKIQEDSATWDHVLDHRIEFSASWGSPYGYKYVQIMLELNHSLPVYNIRPFLILSSLWNLFLMLFHLGFSLWILTCLFSSHLVPMSCLGFHLKWNVPPLKNLKKSEKNQNQYQEWQIIKMEHTTLKKLMRTWKT